MDIKQYLLFNKELELSPGKWGVQSAHTAARFERAVSKELFPPLFSQDSYEKWASGDEKKIAVRASLKQLEKLESEGWICVRDNGHTEVESGTLTVVISPPLSPEELPGWLKRLQLYK